MTSDIITSWEKNAHEWIAVIQNQSIPSRKFTNRAILKTISDLNVNKVADLGCGEGWLTREMSALGLHAVGFDVTEALLKEARKSGTECYYQLSFEAIISEVLIPEEPFDAAIFNFCLYIKEGLVPLLQQMLTKLIPNGYLVIQTLHPFFLIQNGFEYKSQWLSNSWKGLPGNFQEGHSWYARTFEDWINLISSLENTAFEIQEIKNEENNPISLILKIKKLQ